MDVNLGAESVKNWTALPSQRVLEAGRDIPDSLLRRLQHGLRPEAVSGLILADDPDRVRQFRRTTVGHADRVAASGRPAIRTGKTGGPPGSRLSGRCRLPVATAKPGRD